MKPQRKTLLGALMRVLAREGVYGIERHQRLLAALRLHKERKWRRA